MSTLYQCLNKKKTKKAINIFNKKPQIQCVVWKIRIVTPRKPNSARRICAKVFIYASKFFMKKYVVAYIPGSGHNLRKHSHVLICGGGARDLPGVNFSCIRGVLDLSGCLKKTKRRSIYGVPKPVELKKKLRRKFRV